MFILKRKYLIIPTIFTKNIQFSKYTMKLYVSPSLWLTEYSIAKDKIDSSQTKIYSICKFQKSLKRLRAALLIKKSQSLVWSLNSNLSSDLHVNGWRGILNNTARLDSNSSPQISMKVCSAHSMLWKGQYLEILLL